MRDVPNVTYATVRGESMHSRSHFLSGRACVVTSKQVDDERRDRGLASHGPEDEIEAAPFADAETWWPIRRRIGLRQREGRPAGVVALFALANFTAPSSFLVYRWSRKEERPP